jgi:TonB-linked SusC/RagA family outer membrane protein
MNKYQLKIKIVMLLIVSVSHTFAQTITVEGVVKDKIGALTGVTVSVKGTSTGSITNINGEYNIQVSAKGSLQFSFMGYETKIVAVDGRKTIHVTLNESSVDLDEVVVVGYGTQKKRDITGAIVSISAAEISKNSPADIGEALQGKVAGLSILTSSEPGKDAQFKIRGMSTLGDESGSNPLFVVDGMEVSSISGINPKDIASVEVLKDAASASIYGSRSANGVILITTKQGEKNKPLFNVGYSVKMSNIAKTIPQMNRLEANNYDEIRGILEGTPNAYVITDSLSPIYLTDVFYQDILFRTGLTHQVDMSVSGADNKIKYYVSTGFRSDDGIYINSYNRRLNARLNATYQATSKLSFGTMFLPTVVDVRSMPWGTSRNIVQRPSYLAVYHPVTGDYMPYVNVLNPVAMSTLGKQDKTAYVLYFNQFIKYQFSKALYLRVSLTANANITNSVYSSPGNQRYDNLSNASNGSSLNTGWNQENTLSYTKQLKKSHSVNALFGFGLRHNQIESIRISGSGMPSSMELVNSYELLNYNSTYAMWTQNRMASFFTRLGYNYKGRYLFNSNIRADGSSRFGKNKQWGLFPSLSTGWRFSDEKFMSWSKPFVKDAKLRLSYGITGNQTAGDFASMRLYQSAYYAASPGLIPTQLENSHLGWENTTQKNIGLDLMFVEGRINLVADIYEKYTTDVLYNVRLPQTSGFATTYKNIGDVSNKGIEVSLNTINFRNNDWEWSTSFNFAVNKNVIASIPVGGEQFINDIYYIAKGYQIGTMYGYKALSIFPYDESNAFTSDWQQLTPVYNVNGAFQDSYMLNGQTVDIKPSEVNRLRYDTPEGQLFKGGDVMWEDINNDGIIDTKDRQVLGHGMPRLTGGLGTDLKYKNFSLTAFFNYSFGNDVYNFSTQNINANVWSPKTKVDPVIIQNSWLTPGDEKKFPKPANSSVQNTRVNSSLWIEDGSFIRLANVKLSYDCPKKLYTKLNLKGLTFSLQGNNLLTWTNYTGFDPEVLVSSFTAGYDGNSYPRARTVMLGINVNL